MLRLLIVDDEAESLAWLKEMFEAETSEEMLLYTASSGRKALEVLNSVKCDVVLTDIKMPGMDGMELYRHVKENWPRARVVFLTGYSTHELLYQAVQDREIRYLLKTETPEKIVSTVLEAYHELMEQQEQLLQQERKDALLQKAQYWMQKEFMERLIYEGPGEEPLKERMEELGLSFQESRPAAVFLGRADTRKELPTLDQQERILLSVRENLPGTVRTAVYFLESRFVFGLIQPKLVDEGTDWKRVLRTCEEALEDVQEICTDRMGISAAFAVYQEPVGLERLGQTYHALKNGLMTVLTGEDAGILAVGGAKKPETETDGRTGLVKLPMLEAYLEQGNYEAFREVLQEISMPLLTVRSMHDIRALELYYNISMIYLKYINANGWQEKLPFYIALYPLTRADDFADWNEAVEYLFKLAEAVFRLMREADSDHRDQAILRVEQYIRTHLKEDLSLPVLADVGGFNASYLSRTFKRRYHCNLYDYITRERLSLAKELLMRTGEKIYQIGEEAGYHTASSFNRAFLKSEGMTPAEYRQRYQAEKQNVSSGRNGD